MSLRLLSLGRSKKRPRSLQQLRAIGPSRKSKVESRRQSGYVSGMSHLGPWSREERIEKYASLRRQQRDGYGRWLLLIKELRTRHDASIIEAERIALSSPHRRRWVEKQINMHQQCRKKALSHIRHNGVGALIEREGDTFRFTIRKAAFQPSA